jgi:DNA-binding transcriptional MerR regulator
MKVSQLCEVSGVPLPSIKYYLREGLLPPGERTSANQAEYDETHVERLRLIRALIDVGGLSVATANRVLAAVDDKDLPLSYVFGVAQYAISDATLYDPVDENSLGVAAVNDTIERMGWNVPDDSPGRHGAARIINTYADLGQDHLAEISDGYAQAAELIAREDLAAVGRRSEIGDMAQTVVVGTVLGDGLIASLRRMAQAHVSYEVFPPQDSSQEMS